jgi:hypothetical protein
VTLGKPEAMRALLAAIIILLECAHVLVHETGVQGKEAEKTTISITPTRAGELQLAGVRIRLFPSILRGGAGSRTNAGTTPRHGTDEKKKKKKAQETNTHKSSTLLDKWLKPHEYSQHASTASEAGWMGSHPL